MQKAFGNNGETFGLLIAKFKKLDVPMGMLGVGWPYRLEETLELLNNLHPGLKWTDFSLEKGSYATFDYLKNQIQWGFFRRSLHSDESVFFASSSRKVKTSSQRKIRKKAALNIYLSIFKKFCKARRLKKSLFLPCGKIK